MLRSFFYSLFFLFLFLGFKAQNRVVLIEQFSNSSCPPCAAVSPSVYAYANANPTEVVVVAYHTLFPYNNDSMYFENPVEATQRVNFYGVNAVPYSILDGNVYNGSTSSFVGNISNLVNNRLNTAARFDIEALGLSLSGNVLSGNFRFTSTDSQNSSENLVAQLVVIEKNVLKSSYAASPGANSETEYGYVMRKMIPDASGTALINTFQNGSDDINFNWSLSHIKDLSQLRVVAFVQNNDTKEVYQAALFEINGSPVGINTEEKFDNEIDLYPNPAHDVINISLQHLNHISTVQIIKTDGTIQYSENVNLKTDKIQLNLNLQRGIYYLKLTTAKGNIVRKLLVQN
ncbi:MAG: Omp28-related outer membrane protein [Bacteroidia bacterium]|nr:Omp28-related outer membrane protein [Bacteroidia bacterium]